MEINGHKLFYGSRLPNQIVRYLHNRYESLERLIEREFPELDVSLTISRQSEAAYFTLRPRGRGGRRNSYKISIRNHGNFARSDYDKAILLSRHEDWDSVKHEVLNLIVAWSDEKVLQPA